MSSNLSPRAHKLMKVLVENYLKHGQPVGSGKLAEISDLSVSSATIRNIMGELEQQGLVASPHTSAGRIPTNLGVRLFVDNLLTIKDLDSGIKQQLTGAFDAHKTTEELLTSTSQLLSEITSMVGLVKMPSRRVTRIKHMEFMPLTEKRILVVLVLDDHEVQNRVIYSERAFTPSELVQATNIVNQYLVGQELAVARKTLLEKMREEKQALDSHMQHAIELAEQGLATDQVNDDYHLAGDRNLLELAEGEEGLDNLKAIFNAFQQKQDVLALLDKALEAQGMQIFIGEECATDGLNSCSVVTAPYQFEGRAVGVLAVVGPTRMYYDKVIPVVDITAKLLSSALNQPE
ncbi:heat-inducible transcriptional repressor HrcA [Pleionea sediminis]|uniref:heat-inducible transcriptional repressor HrcA n=1 Tax=Pleionea sediminis TaxID=2569479 RepID=UPI001184F60D|nr:heat-inducible transcriptional repressor HrcA [Pleionea sediminis]